jgi:hypothetical protein
MAKRFTATEKWDKAWFRKLSPRHKSLWQFLVDRCDQVGMWEVDVDSASHFINDSTPITEDDFKIFGPRLEKFGNDKLWIVDFVSFQCGDLSERSPAHKPIFKLLKKYNLLNRVLLTLSNRVLEIEKEIEKEKEEEKEVEKEKERPNELVFGDKGARSIAVKKVYAIDQTKRIYDLEKYFQYTGQLEEFKTAGLTQFDAFMEANPANVFKDPDHLYNTFRKFCITDQLNKVAKGSNKKITIEDLNA